MLKIKLLNTSNIDQKLGNLGICKTVSWVPRYFYFILGIYSRWGEGGELFGSTFKS